MPLSVPRNVVVGFVHDSDNQAGAGTMEHMY